MVSIEDQVDPRIGAGRASRSIDFKQTFLLLYAINPDGTENVEGVIEDAEDYRLPLEQAIKIAQETCPGMELPHSRGIVYRDLKPGNLWLTED